MSQFECLVLPIEDVYDHPNADRLSLCKVRDFITVAGKLEDGSPRYKKGDLIVYCPEGSVIPEYLLKQGFWDDKNGKGGLTGSLGNRVKAIKLRGVLSQGIMFPTLKVIDLILSAHISNEHESKIVNSGDDVSEFLGITKFEPVIPAAMNGDLLNLGTENTLNFDIENLRKYPNVLQDGERVVVSEKLHGTFCCVAYIRDIDNVDLYQNKLFVASKGLGSRGLVFKFNNVNQQQNIYTKMAVELGLFDKLKHYAEQVNVKKCFLLGEIFGQGVQDLHYGMKPTFKAFDLWAQYDNDRGGFVSSDNKKFIFRQEAIDQVPILYEGPYSRAVIDSLVGGLTSLGESHIKEGIVITPNEERNDSEIGRVILKHISAEYLTRKGNLTEYN